MLTWIGNDDSTKSGQPKKNKLRLRTFKKNNLPKFRTSKRTSCSSGCSKNNLSGSVKKEQPAEVKRPKRKNLLKSGTAAGRSAGVQDSQWNTCRRRSQLAFTTPFSGGAGS
jgi:hypothetical protein